MIPSRPLRFNEIIGETFSISIKIFLRYALLYLVLAVPGVMLMNEGVLDMFDTTVRIAQTQYGLTDAGLTTLRNETFAKLSRENPAFQSELEMLGARPPASADSTLTIATVGDPKAAVMNTVTGHSTAILQAGGNFWIGIVWYLLGTTALMVGTSELAVQVFEERKQRLGYSIRRVFAHHLWAGLGVVVFYLIASVVLWLLSMVVSEIPTFGQIATAAIFVIWVLGSCGVALSIATVVSENCGPVAALRKSIRLTTRARWKVLGNTAALALIEFPMLLALSIVTSVLFLSDSMTFWQHLIASPVLQIGWLLTAIPAFFHGSVLASAIDWLPLTGLPIVLMVVLFYDLKTRLEGPISYDEPSDAEPMAPVAMWQP